MSVYNLEVSVTVFFDDARHPFAVALMCHMWADSFDAFPAMVDCVGGKRNWLQKLPKAFWMHFDRPIEAQVRRGSRRVATDRYGALEHPAWLAQLARIRARAE